MIESQKAEDEDLKQNLFEREERSVYNITDRQTGTSGRESVRVQWKREWEDQPVLLTAGLFLYPGGFAIMKIIMKAFRSIILIFLFLSLFSCADKKDSLSYTQITQEEAMRMMEEEDCIILDVRTIEEYNEGHIPDALCIPVETIGNNRPEELPDPDQIILVYCRTGVRAAQASEKLVKLGYTKVYDFGGIVTWKGDIVIEGEEIYREPEAALAVEVKGRQIYTNTITKKELLKTMGIDWYKVSFKDEGSIKRAVLPFSVSLEEEETEVKTGDVLLCSGNEILLVLEEGTLYGEKIGFFVGMTKGELEEIFGEGDFTALLFLDWLDY